MRHRISVVVVAPAALVASLLASCGGDDEGYPPFRMMYMLQVMDGPEQIWQLDYRSADDWTKTLIESDEGMPVGRTARWEGERIAWAESPDGQFVEDQAPEPPETHALPEFWFAPANHLEALPNDFWIEVEPATEGTRRFRNESPQGVGGLLPVDDNMHIVQVLTIEQETGIPVGYENKGMHTLEIYYRVLDLELR